jgi:predicted small secreted protein
MLLIALINIQKIGVSALKKIALTFISVLLLASLVLTGCGNSASTFIKDKINPNIDVLGIQLGMTEEEVFKLAGSDGEKALCTQGYEYAYSEKKLNIGFNSETKTVRRVTTKNPDTTIFGIKPGMTVGEAFTKIDGIGFTKDSVSNYKFHNENVTLTVLSMDGAQADGVIIEIDPE